MKINYRLLKGIFAFTIVSASFVSCSEDIMDGINADYDHPKSVQAKFILADVITSTAFDNVGGEINTYTSTYVEHEVGVHNQLWNAEFRISGPSTSSTYNNPWERIYSAIRNAKIALAQCSEDGNEKANHVTRGIAEVLLAYNGALVTDLFGDTPWSQAGLQKEDGTPLYMTPKIDKQEDIYKDVFKLLDDAIVNLQESDSLGIGNYDFLYKGNGASWVKFAYGLKARYTMRLLNRSTDVEGDLNKVLDYISKSFTSVSDQASYAIYDASNLNPLFDFQWSRDALGASESLSEKLIERNDPRIRRIFIDADLVQMTGADDENFFMAPNGEPEQLQYYYNTSAFVYSQTAPTLLLSYHEILFLKAEALCRLNRIDEAEEVLKEAVIAGIVNTEINVTAAMSAPLVLDNYAGLTETTEVITTEEAETYFETSVQALFAANPLKETMIQKYLAFSGASGESTETFNDIRRMKAAGEDFIALKNPNKFVLRLGYGSSDTTANPEVKAAFGDGQYVYSEPVWWAGGTR